MSEALRPNRKLFLNCLLGWFGALVAVTPHSAQAVAVTFDDFNVNSGHFTSTLSGGSGSTLNVASSSTATRVTTNSPLEGAGHQKLVLNATTAGSAMRLRHLSGGGTPANNSGFTTSAGDDGWIGVYIKTLNASTDPNWTVEFYLEGSSTNGSVKKTIIADGARHLYEWNLDDTSGGPDGWGTVANVIAGSATVADGSHTIDSIIFRNPVGPASTELYMDFVAKSASGSVSNLLLDPCLNTSGVLVTGPVSTNVNQVIVTGVSGTATTVSVYQNTGASGAMVQIGTKTTGITSGNDSVTVSGLVKGAIVAATQTVGGQQSCVPTTGITVGGGASPSIRIAYSVRETSSTGPVGAAGDSTSANIHFLGATTVSSGAPVNAAVVFPSNQWQTVAFQRGPLQTIGASANATGTVASAAGYAANDTVSIQAYAFRTLTNGVTIYSAAPAQSSDVTSNNVFTVNWTWSAVSGAQGYRLLRSLNFAGYGEFADVVANSYNDAGTGWAAGSTVTPTASQSGKSVQWNPSVTNVDNLPGQWGILEAIGLSINNLDDTGPFDFYLDNVQNGTTVFQDFEGAVAGTTDFGFRQPSFSGTTSGNILTAPIAGVVANEAADTGTKSFHIRFQWSGTNATKWLRLTTSGVGNPMVNLDDPISIRLLLLPVGASLPAAPPGPSLSISLAGGNAVLNWLGAHNLQAAPTILGVYTNVPGVTVGPTNQSLIGSAKFFRLNN